MKAILALFMVAAAAAYHNVTVKNLRLFDGNTEYFIKSICYSPAPVGYAFGSPKQGSGVCSLRTQYALDAKTKNLDSISACYYEDFFDGSVDPSGAGNQKGWFYDIWTRDLPVIKDTGANVVRFYHTNPITRDLVFQDSGYANKGYGSDYRPFLDACEAHGLKVVFPLFAELTQILNFPTAKMEEYIRSLVDNVGNHPALLMWQFGNELPLTDPSLGPGIIAKLNHFFDYARTYTWIKWVRHVPISIALVDLPSGYNQLVRDLKTDIVTTNAGYRGPGYSDLWTGNSGQNFDGLHKLSCQYGKPVWIGEIGQHSSDGFFSMNEWFPQNWDALIQNYKNGAIGGALFEYSDEAWKAENQRHMGIVKLDDDTHAEKKTASGAYNYDSVKSAFSRDIFAEMNRAPFTLSNVDNSVCAEFPQFTAMTGPIYPFIDIGSVDTTPVSTYTSDPAPTNNNGGDAGGNAGSGNCGAGLSECGKACYVTGKYCCVQGTLFEVADARCSATTNPAPASTTSADVANPATTSANNGNGSPTTTSADNGNAAPATTSAGNASPATTTANAAETPASTTVAEVNNGASTTVEDTVARPQDGSASKIFSATVALFVLLAVV